MDQKTSAIMFSSESGEYGTPDWVFNPLNDRFKFTLDAAASHENHKVPMYYTQEGLFLKHFSSPYPLSKRLTDAPLDGLSGPWDIQTSYDFTRRKQGSRVWLNPPYGRGIEDWVRKCASEMPNCDVIVALLPARTETEWFQRWVFPYAEVHFIYGRIKFDGGESSAPFPSVLAVYQQGLVSGGIIRARVCDLKSDPVFTGGLPLKRP